MINAIDSLAFSIQANKGVYALLLGSGISRAARIPTGWEITLELVRKIAALEGADCEPDPATWFQTTRGKSPDYSELLNALAKTASERQQLLRSYWEPTEQEREEGAKLPTKAHRAIADLVKLGYIKVILTTNFDRLLETALHDVGIQPAVLSTADHIEGALPLIHTSCTIVKIHGDYLDTRILNTTDELAAYPEPFNKLLDRIFDEFGLIVAGWSADWDEALRSAMTRAPYRRFSTYWATRGDPSEKAASLIGRKGATVVKIADADSFFVSVSERVKALEEFSLPHPLSVDVAVSTLKKYLSEPRFRIALDDLVSGEITRLWEASDGTKFSVTASDLTGESLEHRLHAYEAAAVTTMRMAFVAGQWAEGPQVTPWGKGLAKLSMRRADGGNQIFLALQRYPATLLLYAFGLGAVLAERWDSLHAMFSGVVVREHREDKRVVELVPVWALFEFGGDGMKILPGREREYTPLNNRIASQMWNLVGKAFQSEPAFNLAFDWFEVLAALNYAIPTVEKSGNYWTLPGAYGWRRDNMRRIVSAIRQDLTTAGDKSTFVTSALVGKSAEKGLENLAELERFVPEFRWR